MATKVKVKNINDSKDCPFYVEDTKNKCGCFWKKITTSSTVIAITEDNPEYDSDTWDIDCQGLYEKCTFIPLLYNVTSETEKSVYTDVIEKYDPFSEDDDEEVVVKKQVNTEKQTNTISSERFSCKVSIHKVDNPYGVKTDVFVYPTNNMLVVDDPLLVMMTEGYIQKECNLLARSEEVIGNKIELGQVYATRSGIEHIKAIYHAVLLTNTRIINEMNITNTVYNSLIKANMDNANSITMLPFDCGILDVSQAALTQLLAIHTFLDSTPDVSFKNIFIVMDDDLSVGVFNDYYNRIWKK